ncbi:hypothetical protein, partial [Enterobacter kobei]|uniref:hypothetical protein n=1 Tax=Enterobacter kobei TaxID=208224 RepID=UPI0013D3619F
SGEQGPFAVGEMGMARQVPGVADGVDRPGRQSPEGAGDAEGQLDQGGAPASAGEHRQIDAQHPQADQDQG